MTFWHNQTLARPLGNLAMMLKSLRGPAMILLLLLCLGVVAMQVMKIAEIRKDNELIIGLSGKRNLAVALDAPAEVLLARSYFLSSRLQLPETMPLLDELSSRNDTENRKLMLYNIGNARMRLAMRHIEGREYEKATAEINLAKDEYRTVLRDDPGYWNAKHNLEFASRLVRDFAPVYREGDGEEVDDPDKLWSDLPGIPRGLP